jgi:hypothetical protein
MVKAMSYLLPFGFVFTCELAKTSMSAVWEFLDFLKIR